MTHGGVTRLVAQLSPEDYPDWGSLRKMPVRVSPNGRWLAFMSNRSLTGYDMHDAFSGRPDEEVYLYDASGDKLVCASCNPSGARPVGVERLRGITVVRVLRGLIRGSRRIVRDGKCYRCAGLSVALSVR